MLITDDLDPIIGAVVVAYLPCLFLVLFLTMVHQDPELTFDQIAGSRALAPA